MIDAEGELGSKDQKGRLQAEESHYKWVEVSNF